MSKAWVLLWLLVPGCGRLGFDAVGATGDGAGSDGIDSDGVTGGGGPAVSCETLPPTCGPAGTSPCCESPVVTGGTYFRSYDGVGHNDNGYPATLSTFRLDKYEITVGRFRKFVLAGMGTQQSPPASGAGAHAQIPGSGWNPAWNGNLPADTTALITALKCFVALQTWTDAPGGNENRPINCISWYEAMAFCAWDGGFLPTDAEWNYAAAGGSLQRAYPWSSPPGDLTLDDSTYVSYYPDGSKQCMGDGVMGCTLADIVPVGTKPAGDGLWGHSDIAGNAWEWTLDWYASPYPMTTCNDCANLTTATNRAIRGGGYHTDAPTLRGAYRLEYSPTIINYNVGARCGRSP